MAKGSGNEDRAKVKLRVIEFELEGGNASVENSIRQLTHALTNRTTTGTPQRVAGGKPAKELPPGTDIDDAEENVQESEFSEAEDANTEQPSPKPSKPRAPAKYRMPVYLHDLDMIGTGVTFKDFAAQKKPSKNTQKHLVAAYWLKEHGNMPTVNIDRVYTCYRTAGWSTNQPDWDMNFRGQMSNDRFRRVNSGEYAITPIGEDDVRKMNGTE